MKGRSRSPELVGRQNSGGGTAFNDRHTFPGGRTARTRFGEDALPESLSRSVPGSIRTAGSVVRSAIFLNPLRVGIGNRQDNPAWGPARVVADSFVKGLILAQNERWRRGLGMQVERAWLKDQVSGARVSKATATNPMVGHSRGKLRVIPSDVRFRHLERPKASAPWDGLSWY